MKTELTKLKVNTSTGNHYFVTAELVKDYNLTPITESVAWNGTLQLYKDKEDRYYLSHHTGNSKNREVTYRVDPSVEDETAEEALEYIYN